jgi:hypothetical protein
MISIALASQRSQRSLDKRSERPGVQYPALRAAFFTTVGLRPLALSNLQGKATPAEIHPDTSSAIALPRKGTSFRVTAVDTVE